MPATAGGLAGYVENVLRTLTARLGPAADTSITDVPPVLDAVRILVLVVVLITVPLAEPHLGSGADGIGVAASLGHPGTRVVVLTTYADDDSIIGALQAGALGYLTKDATRAEIGRAVLAAAAGQAVLDPGVQQRLLSGAARAAGSSGFPGPARVSGSPAASSGHGDLTPREAEVLRLIAAGASNREVARALYVSEATVKTHVNRIFAKTGSRDRVQAMRYAYSHGYADPAPPS
jgi:DNA-binding NarL/FixJ family response regulator